MTKLAVIINATPMNAFISGHSFQKNHPAKLAQIKEELVNGPTWLAGAI